MFGTDFFLALSKEKSFLCRFCGGPDNDGHVFWECLHPPFVHIRESVEFRDLLLRDESSWPGCLLWHGWLPALACTGGASSWAASAEDIACARLERLLVLILKETVGNGSLLIIFLIVLSLLMFLIILMFGLMVALFLMSYPVLGLVGVVFTL